MTSRFTYSLFGVFLVIFCTCACAVKANDTLTFRQVYNINVGDTFDFVQNTVNTDANINYTMFVRKVLLQKTFSIALDTVYFAFGPPGGPVSEMDTITDLDSTAIFHIPNQMDSGGRNRYTFDTTIYSGRISNSNQISQFESGANYTYTQGLGRTRFGYSVISISGMGGCGGCYSEELIYYANDSVRMGTPYYVANGSTSIHYIPLPEQCAMWTWSIYGTYAPYPPPIVYGTITEQVRTGNITRKNGINYVQLICRIENEITGQYTPDSILGYFYNDTIARTAYFVQDTNSNSPTVLCSFNGLTGDQCSSSSTLIVDSILIGGAYRTYWHCPVYQPTYGCMTNMISGIGSLNGLFPYHNLYYGSNPECSRLTCFSVCGQTLYPSDTIPPCALLTGVKNVGYNRYSIQCSPNPFTSDLSIAFNLENPGAAIYSIRDLLGQSVYEAHELDVSNGYTKTLDLSELSSGIYLLTVSVNGEAIVKRIIKE